MPMEQVGVDQPYVRMIRDDAVKKMFNSVQRRVDEEDVGEGSPKEIYPALTLFSSEKYMSEFFFDIKIYMESCLICSELKAKAFLITDDHRFFRFFFHSPVAEQFLRDAVKEVLCCDTIPLKLAGEVIPGV